MSYTVNGTDGIEYQLQLFNGKTYEPSVTGDHKDVRAAFDMLAGVARRLVRSDKARPLKPKLPNVPRASRARSKYETDCLIGQYLTWAKAKGLKQITAYRGVFYGAAQGMGVRHVEVKDFLGSEITEEIDP